MSKQLVFEIKKTQNYQETFTTIFKNKNVHANSQDKEGSVPERRGQAGVSRALDLLGPREPSWVTAHPASSSTP